MVDISALGNFKSGFAGIATYSWILWFLVPVALLIFGVYLYKIMKDKKKQWTHTLKIKRVLNTGFLSPEVTNRMKRFPLVKNASIFQLEHPFLGSYLIPELDSYTGTQEFSVIIDRNNRVYINTGETFVPETSSVNISAKHAAIDLAFEDLKSDWQEINKVSKRTEWTQIAKFALMGLLIIASMVVMIKGVGQWGENHKVDADRAAAQAEAMRGLAEAMETSQATMNTQVLILDKLNQLYGTKNLQPVIRSATNVTST